MEELELLKNKWNQQNDCPEIAKERVSAMIHKKSTSTIQWIIIVCLIELIIGVVVHFNLIAVDGNELSWVELTAKYVVYVLSFLLFINIIRGYLRIKVDQSIGSLMRNILYVKKVSALFVCLNVSYFLLAFILHLAFGDMFQSFAEGFNEGAEISSDSQFNNLFVVASVFVITFSFLAVLISLYYRFVFVRLVRKLNNNYIELIRS